MQHYFNFGRIYRRSDLQQFNEDLFIALLPSRLATLSRLRHFYGMLLSASCSDKFMEILHQLVQRLDFVHHENVVIEIEVSSGVFYNNDACTWKEPHYLYVPSLLIKNKITYAIDAYLFSLMLWGLQFNMISVPSNSVSITWLLNDSLKCPFIKILIWIVYSRQLSHRTIYTTVLPLAIHEAKWYYTKLHCLQSSLCTVPLSQLSYCNLFLFEYVWELCVWY